MAQKTRTDSRTPKPARWLSETKLFEPGGGGAPPVYTRCMIALNFLNGYIYVKYDYPGVVLMETVTEQVGRRIMLRRDFVAHPPRRTSHQGRS